MIVFFLLDIVLKRSSNLLIVLGLIFYIGMSLIQQMIPTTLIMFLFHGTLSLINVGAFLLGTLLASMITEQLDKKTLE